MVEMRVPDIEVAEPVIATTWFEEEIREAFLKIIDRRSRGVVTSLYPSRLSQRLPVLPRSMPRTKGSVRLVVGLFVCLAVMLLVATVGIDAIQDQPYRLIPRRIAFGAFSARFVRSHGHADPVVTVVEYPSAARYGPLLGTVSPSTKVSPRKLK